jgi:predicted aldo/keto reductase-like oxidoreductase
VEIPRIFEIYNDASMYDDPVLARMFYAGRFGLKPENRADQCISCEECIAKCPQKIAVPQELKKAHEFLAPKA